MGETPETTIDEFLGGKLRLIQPKKGYRAGSDAVFLAAACPAKPGDAVFELGCGTGAVLFCLARRVSVALCGAERDPAIAELARHNAIANAFRAEIFTADIGALPRKVTSRRFDHVLLNPPYFDVGTQSGHHYRRAARHEETPLRTWIEVGLKRLAPGGHLVLIHTADRLGELLTLLNEYALCTDIKPLAPRENRPTIRVILRVQRSAAKSVTLHNPLILHPGDRHIDDRAGYTPAADAILRRGEALKF